MAGPYLQSAGWPALPSFDQADQRKPAETAGLLGAVLSDAAMAAAGKLLYAFHQGT